MKLKLNKRHREWLVALAVIIIVLAGVWAWASSQPGNTPVIMTLGPITLPVHTGSSSAQKDTSVAGIIAGLSSASDFNNYLISTGVAAQLKGSGPYTVFVPTNSAFSLLAPGTVSGLSAAAQKRLVEYHVVAGKALDDNAVMSGTYVALSKDTLNFNVNLQTGATYVNSGAIINEYKAQNGVVYTISSVLLPPRSN